MPLDRAQSSDTRHVPEDVHNLERLTCAHSPQHAPHTSLWITPPDHESIDGVQDHDVGSSITKSCLFRGDFKAFLSSSGSVPESKSRKYTTRDWSELKIMGMRAGMSDDVQYALQNLIQDIDRRVGADCGNVLENDYVRSWLVSATRYGLKAHTSSPTNRPSLIQRPRFRISPVLIDHLADLRFGNDRKTQISARVISDWLRTDVIDGDADRRKRRTEREGRVVEEEKRVEEVREIFRSWPVV